MIEFLYELGHEMLSIKKVPQCLGKSKQKGSQASQEREQRHDVVGDSLVFYSLIGHEEEAAEQFLPLFRLVTHSVPCQIDVC